MSGMNAMQKVYFICAWIVAGFAILATILLGVFYGGLSGFSHSLVSIFLGVTGCMTLLYLSGFFTNQLALFISGIGVGCLSLLAAVLGIVSSRVCANWGFGSVCAWAPGTFVAGHLFFVLFLGIVCTLLLIRLSGKFGE